jgi:hypothetical protein
MAMPAAADVIADWNICAPGIIGAGRSAIMFGAGPATQLDLAVVHLAMHDAIQAYDRRYESYAGAIAAGNGSAIAAAARAAHSVLLTQFPAQQAAIDTCYATSMTGVVLTPDQLADSDAVGNMAASNVLMARSGDGSFPTGPITPFPGADGPGQWRASGASMVAPWLAEVRPFAIDSVQGCQAEPLPAMTSGEYADNYNEVKAVGSVNSTTRTPEQGHIGRTYSGNFFGQFNRLMRELAAAYHGGADLASLGNRARLFALANTATADAVICAWHAKKAFNFWRPMPAIRAGSTDGNSQTDEDTGWTSYMAAPNYPDYTSGGNNVGGAMTRMLALFFGSDRLDAPFRIYWLGGAVPLQPGDADHREYTRFSAIAKEIIDARIYLGIHFRFADTEARSQGRRVANETFRNILTRIRK